MHSDSGQSQATLKEKADVAAAASILSLLEAQAQQGPALAKASHRNTFPQAASSASEPSGPLRDGALSSDAELKPPSSSRS